MDIKLYRTKRVTYGHSRNVVSNWCATLLSVKESLNFTKRDVLFD